MCVGVCVRARVRVVGVCTYTAEANTHCTQLFNEEVAVAHNLVSHLQIRHHVTSLLMFRMTQDLFFVFS